eukprot:CAMPEP_0173422890 /NCGR_PEP_ID=MMETSP1357-20121228/3418_1 /TAXON_ID=77926 /ORGANISM="Hemiselmis rufescens, Strain PCC563" /LENGTH=173 /DNA_ID=CAMNT_0014385945 /DNA_START=119 /DNA_END=637 /DNA_ORIENTATION=-
MLAVPLVATNSVSNPGNEKHGKSTGPPSVGHLPILDIVANLDGVGAVAKVVDDAVLEAVAAAVGGRLGPPVARLRGKVDVLNRSEPARLEDGYDPLDEVLVGGALVVCLKGRVAAVRLGGDVDGPVRVALRHAVHAVPAGLEKVVVHHVSVVHQLADPDLSVASRAVAENDAS